jgi:hypothetical protein
VTSKRIPGDSIPSSLNGTALRPFSARRNATAHISYSGKAPAVPPWQRIHPNTVPAIAVRVCIHQLCRSLARGQTPRAGASHRLRSHAANASHPTVHDASVFISSSRRVPTRFRTATHPRLVALARPRSTRSTRRFSSSAISVPKPRSVLLLGL